jgi:hypothetical protein
MLHAALALVSVAVVSLLVGLAVYCLYALGASVVSWAGTRRKSIPYRWAPPAVYRDDPDKVAYMHDVFKNNEDGRRAMYGS